MHPRSPNFGWAASSADASEVEAYAVMLTQSFKLKYHTIPYDAIMPVCFPDDTAPSDTPVHTRTEDAAYNQLMDPANGATHFSCTVGRCCPSFGWPISNATKDEVDVPAVMLMHHNTFRYKTNATNTAILVYFPANLACVMRCAATSARQKRGAAAYQKTFENHAANPSHTLHSLVVMFSSIAKHDTGAIGSADGSILIGMPYDAFKASVTQLALPVTVTILVKHSNQNPIPLAEALLKWVACKQQVVSPHLNEFQAKMLTVEFVTVVPLISFPCPASKVAMCCNNDQQPARHRCIICLEILSAHCWYHSLDCEVCFSCKCFPAHSCLPLIAACETESDQQDDWNGWGDWGGDLPAEYDEAVACVLSMFLEQTKPGLLGGGPKIPMQTDLTTDAHTYVDDEQLCDGSASVSSKSDEHDESQKEEFLPFTAAAPKPPELDSQNHSKRSKQQPLAHLMQSLTHKDRQMVERMKVYAELPPDPSKCLCKVYLGARQCSRLPFQDTPFCKNHQRAQIRIKNGIQGNPLTEFELYNRILGKLRQRKSEGFKWYSRMNLWRYADKLQLEGVDCLSDDQYIDALDDINSYYRQHPAARHNLQLQMYAGPQTVEDRGTEREDYCGELRCFPHYTRAVFVDKLDAVKSGSTIHNATEKVFMSALRATSDHLRHWAIVRRSQPYKGPQSFVHRRVVDRMNHTVTVDSNNDFAPKTRQASKDVRFLQCSLCDKYRRVDDVTQQVFCNLHWNFDRLERERRQHNVNWDLVLHRLSQTQSRCITLDDFMLACPTACINDAMPMDDVFQTTSLFTRFLDCVTSANKYPSDELAGAFESIKNNLPGIAFHCTMLVDTACSDICDWIFAFETCHDFSSAKPNDALLAYSADRNIAVPYSATMRSYVVCTNSNPTTVDRCDVVGCDRTFDRPAGRTFQHQQYTIDHLCSMHYKRLQRLRRTNPQSLRTVLWTDAELNLDSTKQREFQSSVATTNVIRRMTLQFQNVPDLSSSVLTHVAQYTSSNDEFLWRMQSPNAWTRCATIAICPEALCPLRTAKIRATFRKDLLMRTLEAHRILQSMVLFKCRICNSRFPTFHPKFEPKFRLNCLKHCCPKAALFDDVPKPPTDWASFHTGKCSRCIKDLEKVKSDPVLSGIALFSAENNMDFLHGMLASNAVPMDPLWGNDENRLRKEFAYIYANATVVEEMLVALQHMQVSVCYLSKSGLTGFRKNIICFPQELTDLKALRTFWSGLRQNDIVNVVDGQSLLRRARIIELLPAHLLVQYGDDNEQAIVPLESVQQRIKLPWTPTDLKDYLIVFRRRLNNSNAYIEELRVRRNLVVKILKLLTLQGQWRQNQGIEPMHKYFVEFDWLTEDEIEDCLPEDDVPDTLLLHDIETEDATKIITETTFVDWLCHGKFDCELAQTLLQSWFESHPAGKFNETPADLFSTLLTQFLEDGGDTACSTDDAAKKRIFSIAFLVDFVARNCVLPFPVERSGGDLKSIVHEKLSQELMMVNAYVTTWRGHGVVRGHMPSNVIDDRLAHVKKQIFPWPTISENPTRELEDGRFCKAFPLAMPMGTGDLRQPRPRSDFHVCDWMRHVFQYYTGHFLSVLRGQRIVYAVFNTALREIGRTKGNIVHKRMNMEVYTKGELRDLCASRSDLLRTLASWGAEIPTTSMHWHRECHNLEWIVRQMSWKPPWVAGCTTPKNLNTMHWAKKNKANCVARDKDTTTSTGNGRTCRIKIVLPTPTTTNNEKRTQHQNQRPMLKNASNITRTLQQGADEGIPAHWRIHPKTMWTTCRHTPVADTWGYDRIPAFWYTLNLPYNHLNEIHRFHRAVDQCSATFHCATNNEWTDNISTQILSASSKTASDKRRAWAAENPDIVVELHAIRVEVLVNYVMANIVPPCPTKPFLYWLRFEFGANGNPHAHGKCYVAGNPKFEHVLKDEESRQNLQKAGRHDVDTMPTWAEAEKEISDFFDHYVSERHPAKDEAGNALYDFIVENVQLDFGARPQAFNLRAELEKVFQEDEPDLTRLKQLLLALIETGQRHDAHGYGKPTPGVHPCARTCTINLIKHIYCRYLYPRQLCVSSENAKGCVQQDPFRPDLMNLCLERNDALINNHEVHELVMNLGNTDWRALINLWSVLEYLTKYTAKAGKGSKQLGTLFQDVLTKIDQWESDDGTHDLWRRTIMKFYNRILGDRDYTIFEVLHFGLQLPGVLSNFGPVISVSVSNWTTVKSGKSLRGLSNATRATYMSKLELFNGRMFLKRPHRTTEAHLRDISFYCFWRLYSVTNNRLTKRDREPIVALTGIGWPNQAKVDNPAHDDYARRTLYAYMPCSGLSGTDYINYVVEHYYGNCWGRALAHFVRDENNVWCPPWIKRNYETQNKDKMVHDIVIAKRETEKNTTEVSLPNTAIAKQELPFIFESGEPKSDENDDSLSQNRVQCAWESSNRPAWQMHSEAGPNMNAEGSTEQTDPLPEIINPVDIDWGTRDSEIHLDPAKSWWDNLKSTSSTYTDKAQTLEALTDPHQKLFVHIVLKHASELAETARTEAQPKPLRLFLLGTAGTGKTTATQTMLQELLSMLQDTGWPATFVRVAAPTGSAAFNLRFNATTVHRLIHWLTPPYFKDLEPESDALAKFQEYLQDTFIILFDEVSMIGRQMMGRVDARMQQGMGARNSNHESLGGLSCVCVGDPAQCEAICDQQIYDVTPHHATQQNTKAAKLSNNGQQIYSEFDDVVMLTECHRVHTFKKTTLTTEETAYNERAHRFLQIMHRLRDLEWTLEDYYWLCKRKRSMLSLSERLRFHSAPVIMDFRRATESNPENNCEFYNQVRLRQMARETGVPVVRFCAVHHGTSHETGAKLDDSVFNGLAVWMEVAIGAKIILIQNLAVEHGLMNGSQGVVVMIIYTTAAGPNSDTPAACMPNVIIIDFPQYVGPPYYDVKTYPERRTWIPIFPRTTHAEHDVNITRTQYPLVLGWALTPWKAQGMTLHMAIVHIGSKASTPGVVFTALTRVRHPDNLMLDDSFPDMATIMRQAESPSFINRRRWEKTMQVKFARTIRKHMSCPLLFTADLLWPPHHAQIADVLIDFVCKHPDASDEAIPIACAKASKQCIENCQVVWQRLAQWPHSMEIQAARRVLHKPKILIPNVRSNQPALNKYVSHKDWRVSVEDWRTFTISGNLTPSVWELFAQVVRKKLPTQALLYGAHVLNRMTPTSDASLVRNLPRACRSQPAMRFYPYLTRSKIWTCFVICSDLASPESYTLTVLLPQNCPEEAVDWTTKKLMTIFHIASFTSMTFPATKSCDLCVLLHVLSFATRQMIIDEPQYLIALQESSIQHAHLILTRAGINSVQLTGDELMEFFPHKLATIDVSLGSSAEPTAGVPNGPKCEHGNGQSDMNNTYSSPSWNSHNLPKEESQTERTFGSNCAHEMEAKKHPDSVATPIIQTNSALEQTIKRRKLLKDEDVGEEIMCDTPPPGFMHDQSNRPHARTGTQTQIANALLTNPSAMFQDFVPLPNFLPGQIEYNNTCFIAATFNLSAWLPIVVHDLDDVAADNTDLRIQWWKAAVMNIRGQWLGKYGGEHQYDAAELLADLLFAHQPGNFQIESIRTIWASTCNHVWETRTFETMAVLQLPRRRNPAANDMNKAHSILDLLQHHEREEEINELQCDTCGRAKQVGQSSYRFGGSNDVVIFRINRYDYDVHGEQIKRHDRIAPELALPFTGRAYRLVSAVEHRGNTAHSGHYQTIVLAKTGWQRRNDAMLEEQCAHDHAPRLNESDIYLLVYAREDIVQEQLAAWQAPNA